MYWNINKLRHNYNVFLLIIILIFSDHYGYPIKNMQFNDILKLPCWGFDALTPCNIWYIRYGKYGL